MTQFQNPKTTTSFAPVTWGMAKDMLTRIMLVTSVSMMVFVRRRVDPPVSADPPDRRRVPALSHRLYPHRDIGAVILRSGLYCARYVHQLPCADPLCVPDGCLWDGTAPPPLEGDEEGYFLAYVEYGSELFEFLPLPSSFVHRYLDPILVFLLGNWIGGFAPLLGLWMKISAVSIGCLEQIAYSAALENDLDILDSMLESEVQAAAVQHFEGSTTRNPPTSR